MNENKIKELEKRIEELKKQWPAHSVPPTMLMQLEESFGLSQERTCLLQV